VRRRCPTPPLLPSFLPTATPTAATAAAAATADGHANGLFKHLLPCLTPPATGKGRGAEHVLLLLAGILSQLLGTELGAHASQALQQVLKKQEGGGGIKGLDGGGEGW
jgi:hypothetical protein